MRTLRSNGHRGSGQPLVTTARSPEIITTPTPSPALLASAFNSGRNDHGEGAASAIRSQFRDRRACLEKPPVNLARKLKGTATGTRHSEGFIRVHINGEYYPRAHLVYQYIYGGPLPSEVHHINGLRDDDRPENLRRLLYFPDTEITQEYLRKAFWLNRGTGELFRKVEEKGQMTLEDMPAGTLGDRGRWEVLVLGKIIRRHRLVYLYVHGSMSDQIKHINGDLTGDRPENLRPVTVSQRHMGKRGKLGRDLPKGVSTKRWI
jgi:HNH endonuclease